GGGGERLVAPAAPAAARHGDLVAVADQVAQDVAAVAVADEGAGRHRDDQLVGLPAVAVVRPAPAAVLGAPVLTVGDGGRAVGVSPGAPDDGPAVAAAAAVRPAPRHVLLAAETAAAAAAVAALDKQSHAIHKHGISDWAGLSPGGARVRDRRH